MLEELVPLAARIAEALKARGQTVAVADGATGGLISAGLLTIPGGTSFYAGGGIVYSLKGREILLDLDAEALKGMRSVTEPYALLQARAIRDRFGADWGVAESGSAGPGKHPFGIEAGVSAIAVVGPGVELSRTVRTGEVDRVRNMQSFALAAIGLLAEALEG
jgi:PncC family amidohydrolase